MILLYLQNTAKAIRTSSDREVALGRSMRDWMERDGAHCIGGEDGQRVARTGRLNFRLQP